MAEFEAVLDQDAIAPGEMQSVTVGDQQVLVANVDGDIHAIGAICTHEHEDLAEGDIEDQSVVCALHFARFSLKDGSVLEGPAEEAEPVYDVQVRDGKIWVSKTPRGA